MEDKKLEEAKERLEQRGEKVFNLGNLVGSFSINSGSSTRPLAKKSDQSDFNPVFKKGGKQFKPKDVVKEPLIDIFEGDFINVIVEMPGVNKGDIKISLEGKKLTIDGSPKYKKIEVDIKCSDKSNMTWKYNNNILDIKIGRVNYANWTSSNHISHDWTKK